MIDKYRSAKQQNNNGKDRVIYSFRHYRVNNNNYQINNSNNNMDSINNNVDNSNGGQDQK